MSDIDAMIAAEFTPADNAQPQADAPQAEVSNEAEAQQEPTTETQETPDADNSDDDNVVFPKKAINALSRKDKQIGKLRAQLEQLKAMQQQATTQPAQPQVKQSADGEPNIADFDNHIDYLEARAEWKLEQKLKEREGKQEQTFKTQQEQQWISQRVDEVDKQSEDFAKEYPQIIAITQEYAETIQALPPQIKLALLKADNPPLALLNLATSGVLDDLGDMSLEDARVEIKLALKQQPQKPKSNAPKPMASARGAVVNKSLDNMSPEELVKKFKSF